MRLRVILISLAAVVIVALVALSLADHLLVDYLWFGRLGYGGVFDTTVGAEIAIFAIVWLVAFVAIFASGLVAIGSSRDRERLRVVRRPDEMVEVNLPELIRALGERVPWRVIVAGGAAVLALFVAQGEAASWDTYLKGLYGVPFGIVEQAFGNDIGFYVFTVPLLEEIRDLLLMLIVMSAAMAIAVYWARGALDFKESPPRVAPGAAAHLSVLLGLFFIQRAMSYWLGRFDLLFHTDGVVFGLRYVDRILWQPGLWLLVALSLAAAVICMFNAREGGLRIPVAAFVIVFAPALIMNFIQPVIERLWVKPDELRVERPYLQRNIEATRHAYKLDTVDVKPFAGQGTLTPAALEQDSATVKNIRLWDPRPLIDTYRQLQEIRTYYDFRDVDIDRYWIEGKYTEVMPVFYIKDIPAVSDVGLKIDQPAIYFGEARDSYAIVDSATPEFDYPKGADNVFSYYGGSGGVPVAGFFRRLLFSVFFCVIDTPVTENIVAKSKIMIRRNIAGRIAYLAPFLNLDRDPYAVIYNGRMVWIVDCYTSSDHYPYSQRNGDGINYIRNSVKVVVDAYTG